MFPENNFNLPGLGTGLGGAALIGTLAMAIAFLQHQADVNANKNRPLSTEHPGTGALFTISNN